MRLKKLSALFLSAAMIASLTACGGGSGNKSQSASDEIVVSSQPENGEYDPAGATAYVYFGFQSYCLEGLIDYDEKGGIVAAAAETWESNDDATEWTFHLRKDGKWSDGSSVTSADFLNTIKRALDPDKGSWYVDSLFIIQGATEAFNGEASVDDIGVECPDDYTITFKLTSSTACFLDLLRLPVFMPSNVKYATNDDEGWDIDPAKNLGNGPYSIGEYKAGEYIVYKKNEYFHDADKVKLSKVTEKFMDDDQAKTSAYKTGELDVVSEAPYYVADQYDGQEDLVTSPVLVTNYILFNINEKPFDDVRVRQAFSLAVSRADITTVIGSCYTPSTTFIAKNYLSKVDGTKWGDVQGDILEENLEKAKALLAEAGYANGEGLPEITYTYPSMTYEADVAQVLQSQWAKLGVTVNLEAMEYEVYVDARRNGELQLARHQWTGDYNDPQTWLDMYREGNAQNDVKWVNEEYNKIMNEASAELDATKRQELLKEAEKILVSEDTVICPLFTTDMLYLVNPDINDYYLHCMGGCVFKFATKGE